MDFYLEHKTFFSNFYIFCNFTIMFFHFTNVYSLFFVNSLRHSCNRAHSKFHFPKILPFISTHPFSSCGRAPSRRTVPKLISQYQKTLHTEKKLLSAWRAACLCKLPDTLDHMCIVLLYFLNHRLHILAVLRRVSQPLSQF